MRLLDIADYIEKMSPLHTQESWDNSGFQIKSGNPEIESILVAMEINNDVIDEAIAKATKLIVTHHPLIFGGVKSVDDNDITGNYLIRLISHGINVYSTHTPFDKCEGGNNDYLAKVLHLDDIQPMTEDESGFCRVGFVDGECTAAEYIGQVCSWTGVDRQFVSFVGDPNAAVDKVGLCTGAGADFMKEAVAAGCDLFVTGDVKYHVAQTAKELGLNFLDLGHFGTENLFRDNMAEYLNNCGNNLKIFKSEVDLNPFVRI